MPFAALVQVAIYTGIGIALTFLSYFLFKDVQKAALVSLLLLSLNLFFGPVHDLSKSLFGQSAFINRYIFLFPFFVLLTLILVLWLKKTRRPLRRLYTFINLLLIIFTLFEVYKSSIQIAKGRKPAVQDLTGSFLKCDTCAKPDVYIIVTDEYAGSNALSEAFEFDNSAFETELKNRGFHVVPSSLSNYNFTAYSIASLFSMDYVKMSGSSSATYKDMLLCRSIINNNNTGLFFKNLGYVIHNSAFFDLQGVRKNVNNYFFPPRSLVLNFETLQFRFRRDAGFNFLSPRGIERVEKNDFINDSITEEFTKKIAGSADKGPKFVYTHFSRPHHPYFVDKNGQPFHHPDSLRGFARLKTEYTGYLQYTNKKSLELIDHIKKNSVSPPVILLMSDHGFRQFYGAPGNKFDFMNFCAVHLPGKNYTNFYSGMTLVNTMRVILNAEFGQALPMLKDSTIFTDKYAPK